MTASKPTLKYSSEIARAITWLSAQNIGGGYFRWVHPNPWTPGPISSEITGYAAHLYAWLYAAGHDECKELALNASFWLRQEFECRRTLPVEPNSELVYFFDLGIAARGLFALHAVGLHKFDPLDVAVAVASQMRQFARIEVGTYAAIMPRSFQWEPTVAMPQGNWWSRNHGTYQRKAALIWRLLGDVARYDDLDTYWWRPEPGPVHLHDKLQEADLLHPYAYSAEAMLMAKPDNATQRAHIHVNELRYCVNRNGRAVLRSDVLAQLIRMDVFNSVPRDAADVAELLTFQHESGGFYFRRAHGFMSPDLSVHATMFAIQALVMSQGASDLLHHRELAIV